MNLLIYKTWNEAAGTSPAPRLRLPVFAVKVPRIVPVQPVFWKLIICAPGPVNVKEMSALFT